MARPQSGGGTEDWAHLVANIQTGQDLHASLTALSAKMVKSGMNAGAAVNMLRGFLDSATCPHDGRWQERRARHPRLVESAVDSTPSRQSRNRWHWTRRRLPRRSRYSSAGCC